MQKTSLCFETHRHTHHSSSSRVQCASMITETAAVGKITGGDIQQTPNRLLQTYLDSAPSMSISPASLDPVVLFAGASFTAAASETRTITLANLGTIPVGFNVSVTPSGLIGAFVSALPSTGKTSPDALALMPSRRAWVLDLLHLCYWKLTVVASTKCRTDKVRAGLCCMHDTGQNALSMCCSAAATACFCRHGCARAGSAGGAVL